MEKQKKETSAKSATKSTKKQQAPVAHGVGRRKASVARVWLRKGKGKILVNGRDHTSYFDTVIARGIASKACAVVSIASSYDVEAYVQGGGWTGQAGAVQLGIARAFLSMDEGLRSTLREHDLLTVDSRVKERKKYGRKAARRGFQFVKR